MSRGLRYLWLLSVLVGVPLHAQTYTVTTLYSFCALGTIEYDCEDGDIPSTPPVPAPDGNYYGSTPLGGTSNSSHYQGFGTLYSVTSQGVVNQVAIFCDTLGQECPSGALPIGDLYLSGDGSVLGSGNPLGGLGSNGNIFQFTPPSSLENLYTFCSTEYCAQSADPSGGVIQASSGLLIGVTVAGGDKNENEMYGVIYSLDPVSQEFTVLHKFCQADSCMDGNSPVRTPLEATDGNFYGITRSGGTNNVGIAYRMTPQGDFTVLHQFCSAGGTACTDGAVPYGNIVQGSDGNFYGTASAGGSYSGGTLFRLTPAGQYTVMHNFQPSNLEDIDSWGPGGNLVIGSDNQIYGTTSGGAGTIFRMTYAGDFSIIYVFPCPDTGGACPNGAAPLSGLTVTDDGSFLGTASQSGIHNGGTVFRLTVSPSLKPPVQLSLQKANVSPGAQVNLSWTVSNAFSNTMRQCYAFATAGPSSGLEGWSGKQTGTYSATKQTFSGSQTITAVSSGSYLLSLICGGREAGYTELDVAAVQGATTTTLAASPAATYSGQAVQLTATVARKSGSGTPYGKVNFASGSIVIGSAPLVANGTAILEASSAGVPAGKYEITANYLGYGEDEKSTSSPVAVTLKQPAVTQTVLTITPNPVPTGSNGVDVNVAVTSKSGTPSGSFELNLEGELYGPFPLDSSGKLSLDNDFGTYGIAPGTYTVTASYSSADGSFLPSSDSVTVVVTPR